MNPLAASINGSEKAHRIIRFKGSADVTKSILNVNHFRNPFGGANNMILDRSYEQGQRLIARFCDGKRLQLKAQQSRSGQPNGRSPPGSF